MNYFKKLLLLIVLLSMGLSAQEKAGLKFLSNFQIPGISIRAIEVTNDHALWFAGSKGRYGRIIKDKLEIDSIVHENRLPEFRSIASNGEFVFLLSIENPALLYRIDPKKPMGQWELVYKEQNPKVFYDSLKFFDTSNGLAMGDPTEDCLSILRTTNGGKSWHKTPCDHLPAISNGEAAFAASNSNIAVYENKSWIVTGGSKARVFRSEDFGWSWKTSETPIIQGGKMTGIFTVDFFDDKIGIIMGGDWENKTNGKASKALSIDGGKTWSLIAQHSLPGYISCVQFVPEGASKKIIAVSTEGIYYSLDLGENWSLIDENGYYSLRFIDKTTAWVSKNGEIAKIKLP